MLLSKSKIANVTIKPWRGQESGFLNQTDTFIQARWNFTHGFWEAFQLPAFKLPDSKWLRSTISCLPSYNLRRGDASALALLVRLLKHVFIAELAGASPRKHLNALVRRAVSAPLRHLYPLGSDAFCYPPLSANTLGSSATRNNFLSKSNGFQFTGPKPKVRFRRNAVKSFGIKCISPLDRWSMLQSYWRSALSVWGAGDAPFAPGATHRLRFYAPTCVKCTRERRKLPVRGTKIKA